MKSHGFELEIEIADIKNVHIHEEIVPELLEDLIKDMKKNRVARDPVVVDAATMVVLDGMHRVAALSQMGYVRVPICKVDYHSQRIGLGCWYRVMTGGDLSKISEILKLFNLKIEETSLAVAKRELKKRAATVAILTDKSCLLVRAEKTDIRESYTWVKRIERALKDQGIKTSYADEGDALEKVSGKTAVMLVPCAEKREVLETALSGHVFAHKTTRHVIPERPVNLRVHLSWLTAKKPLREVNRLLNEDLSKRGYQCVPAGQMFEGRRYEEDLLIFR